MTIVEIQEKYPFDIVSTRRTDSSMPYHVIVQLDHDEFRGFRKVLSQKYGTDIQCHISKSTMIATLNFRNDVDFTEFLFVA